MRRVANVLTYPGIDAPMTTVRLHANQAVLTRWASPIAPWQIPYTSLMGQELAPAKAHMLPS